MEQDNNYGLEQEEPIIIGNWSWGAFGFAGLWGIFNGVYWPIIVAIALNVISFCLPESIQSSADIVTVIAELLISLYLGAKGNELAWNNKEWESCEQFERVQHKWAVALGITLAACVILCVILFIIGIML